ncbi:MAG: ATP-binding protein [Candidatus Cloacimonetes bacterium]|nr:ATP-binding protein [Candidatus Cloacimonadota bacterium]
MATPEYIKSLIRSHSSKEPERFYTIALQLAAHEARQGHQVLAQEIRQIVEAERKKNASNVIPFPVDLKGMIQQVFPDDRKNTLILPNELLQRIEQVIHEYLQRDKLKSHGLIHRKKLLLLGPPGTGKTMTARVLAKELDLPLHIVQVDRLMTRYMGETSAKLRQIFDLMQTQPGVYLFDEFDAIGGNRASDSDVGEMRRVVSAFLQFIENEDSDNLILGASNNQKLLDPAMFRRFDDILSYNIPTGEEAKRLISDTLNIYMAPNFAWKTVLSKAIGLSHADIVMACKDALKSAILADVNLIKPTDLIRFLTQRQK